MRTQNQNQMETAMNTINSAKEFRESQAGKEFARSSWGITDLKKRSDARELAIIHLERHYPHHADIQAIVRLLVDLNNP